MNWRDLTILFVILIFAAGLRIAHIQLHSLTFDEQWHLELSTARGSPHARLPEDVIISDAPAVTSLVGARPWQAVWTHMDYVVHPPLYCTTLRLWRNIFGGGDAAARSFSIFASLIAIAFLFFAGRTLHGIWPATFAAILMAAAPTQIFMARQVREYMLLSAISMAAVFVLIRLEKSERTYLKILLGVCVLAMLLTHYFAIAAAGAIGIYVLIRFRGRNRRHAILAIIFAGIFYAMVWGPFMWQQRHNVAETADVWLVDRAANHLLLTIERSASWIWRIAINAGEINSFALLAIALLIVPIFYLRRRPEFLIWILWLASTLGFVTALDLFRGTRLLDFARYVSLASPALFMLFAATVSMLPPLVKNVIAILLAIILLLNWRMADVAEEPDWRLLGQLIDQRVGADETLIFYHGLQPAWYDQIFYLGAAHYSHVFPHSIVKLSRPASEELMRKLPGSSAWLISGQLGGNVSDLLPGTRVIEQYEIPSLVVCTHVELNHATQSR